ncbi:MAG TPA: AEC family transporter [Deltaproteobacteria bacterium]|nr:AEC family transporter [Deltaproteobacteria bacterium]
MDFSARFVLFQAMIIAPFALGYFTKRRYARPEALTKRLIRVNLTVFEPLLVFWSIWGLEMNRELWFLPTSGVLLVLAGMAIGAVLAWIRGLRERPRATFIISSSLANHGFTMGGFLCYLLLGEKGLALSFLFIAYFMPFIFLVIFPYARLVQTGARSRPAWIKDFVLNLQNMPLYAMAAAMALRMPGYVRPDVFFPTDVLLMVSIGLYYFTLGVNFTVRDLWAFNHDNLLLFLVRFLAVPALALLALAGVRLDPGIEAVIMIESFMPAAVYSVVASVLFDLDAKRASSLFVFNTVVFLVVVLPALLFFKTMLLDIIL